MTSIDPDSAAPEAEIPEPWVKPERGLSLVWLAPLAALLIGAWIVWKTVQETGPTIHIAFTQAEGIEAGKTRIRVKDVEVGRVEEVKLSQDLKRVLVQAELTHGAERFLGPDTRIWVVRPRIGLGEVSGLDTLMSGIYIGMDPDPQGGGDQRTFNALEQPPVISIDAPGSFFRLRAQQIGSVDIKTPVYYRRIPVGEVSDYRLDVESQQVEIRVFVHSPYDRLVYRNTRFWHASGLEAKLSADGLSLRVESAEALLTGGISLGLPSYESPQERAEPNARFALYDSFEDARERQYANRKTLMVLFEDSVRGLSIGAPVEFRGIRIGEVRSIEVQFDPETLDFAIPVLLDIEPERLTGGHAPPEDKTRTVLQALVRQGLRAQLKTGNLLTGQLFVALDLFPGAPPQHLDTSREYPLLPSVPGEVQQLTRDFNALMNRIAALPLESVAANLDRLLASGHQTLAAPEVLGAVRSLQQAAQGFSAFAASGEQSLSRLSADLQHTLSGADRALGQAETALQGLDRTLGQDSDLHYQALDTLREINTAARSLRLLLDRLEQRPNALIFGNPQP